MKCLAMLGALMIAMACDAATRPQQQVTVAAIQCSSDLGDVDHNRQKLTDLVTEAAAHGAKIIVLPEAAVTGYLSQDLRTNWWVNGRPIESMFVGQDPLHFAETADGPSVKQFASLAKRLGVYITVPFVERDATAEPPRFFNAICLVSPAGEVVAHYRKLTPWPPPEKSWATPGDRGVQFYDTEYGRVGLAICYDIHTILDKYRPHHLWALLYPIAWVDDGNTSEWFGRTLPGRIAEYHHFLIGANWSTDTEQRWSGVGCSTIIDPDGKVLAAAQTRHGSEIVYATIPTATHIALNSTNAPSKLAP